MAEPELAAALLVVLRPVVQAAKLTPLLVGAWSVTSMPTVLPPLLAA